MQLNCPILGRITEVDRTPYGLAEWPIVRCRETGFVFLENPPDYSKLESEFAWEANPQRRTRSTRKARTLDGAGFDHRQKSQRLSLFPHRNKIASLALASILAKRKSTLAVLDVGCARGGLLRQLYHQSALAGVKVVPLGIEVSREQALQAQAEMKTIGGTVVFANALEGIESIAENSIDLVIMCSFLEHECRPLACLNGVHRVLAFRWPSDRQGSEFLQLESEHSRQALVGISLSRPCQLFHSSNVEAISA